MTINDAKNLIAADNASNTEITDGVVNLLAAASFGLPIDVSQTTATSAISYSGYGNCYDTFGGWDYSFTGTEMTLVGTDTWTENCNLGPEEIFVVSMSTLAADYDIPFNCVDYPICDTSDFNKKLQGVDGDGRSYTSFYYYDGNTKTLTYTKYLPEEVFTEVITIN